MAQSSISVTKDGNYYVAIDAATGVSSYDLTEREAIEALKELLSEQDI